MDHNYLCLIVRETCKPCQCTWRQIYKSEMAIIFVWAYAPKLKDLYNDYDIVNVGRIFTQMTYYFRDLRTNECSLKYGPNVY